MTELICLSVLSGLIEALLPDGKWRSGVRIICGLTAVRIICRLIFDVLDFFQ